MLNRVIVLSPDLVDRPLLAVLIACARSPIRVEEFGSLAELLPALDEPFCCIVIDVAIYDHGHQVFSALHDKLQRLEVLVVHIAGDATDARLTQSGGAYQLVIDKRLPGWPRAVFNEIEAFLKADGILALAGLVETSATGSGPFPAPITTALLLRAAAMAGAASAHKKAEGTINFRFGITREEVYVSGARPKLEGHIATKVLVPSAQTVRHLNLGLVRLTWEGLVSVEASDNLQCFAEFLRDELEDLERSGLQRVQTPLEIRVDRRVSKLPLAEMPYWEMLDSGPVLVVLAKSIASLNGLQLKQMARFFAAYHRNLAELAAPVRAVSIWLAEALANWWSLASDREEFAEFPLAEKPITDFVGGRANGLGFLRFLARTQGQDYVFALWPGLDANPAQNRSLPGGSDFEEVCLEFFLDSYERELIPAQPVTPDRLAFTMEHASCRLFALEHDSAQLFATVSNWKPRHKLTLIYLARQSRRPHLQPLQQETPILTDREWTHIMFVNAGSASRETGPFNDDAIEITLTASLSLKAGHFA